MKKLILTALLLFGCIFQGEKTTSTSSETDLYGYLVLPDSTTRVSGALVSLFTLKNSQAAGLQKIKGISSLDSLDFVTSSTTNSNGEFEFKKLKPNTYHLEAVFVDSTNKDTFSLELPKLSVQNDTNIGEQVLQAPGKLSGRVLFDGKPISSIHVFIPGTSFGAWTDDSGYFEISSIPPGNYEIRVEHPKAESQNIQNIGILSDSTVAITETNLIHKSDGPPPSPDKISAVYDDTTRTVTVTWDSVNVSDLKGYRIYKTESGGSQSLLNMGAESLNPVYQDKIMWQINSDTLRLEYRVKSLDSLGNESTDFKTFTALILPPPPYTPKNLPFLVPEVVAHWNFDEGKGDTLYDLSGNRNHGIVEGATWKIDQNKGYLQFDGVDDRVAFDCTLFKDSCWHSRKLTMELLYVAERVAGPDLEVIFTMYSKNMPISFHMANNNRGAGIFLDTAWYWTITSVSYLSLNKLNHLVYVVDLDEGTSKFYENGKLVETLQLNDEFKPIDFSPYHLPAFGAVFTHKGWEKHFPGQIHDFKIFNGTVSDSTANKLYHASEIFPQ